MNFLFFCMADQLRPLPRELSTNKVPKCPQGVPRVFLVSLGAPPRTERHPRWTFIALGNFCAQEAITRKYGSNPGITLSIFVSQRAITTQKTRILKILRLAQLPFTKCKYLPRQGGTSIPIRHYSKSVNMA